jgi:hypothetical protein
MTCNADIVDFDGKILTIAPDCDISRLLQKTGAGRVELRVLDPRCHTKKQHGKIFGLCADIADFTGYELDEARRLMMWMFCAKNMQEGFSLSDVDMTTAREFINWMVDFVIAHKIPTKRPLNEYAEDLERYMRSCILARKCAICGAENADIHHVDTVGMGRNREKIDHEGLLAVCLCRKHHTECHTEGQRFFEKYHIVSVKLDAEMCAVLKLHTEIREER